jgi:transposase, IS6 family
VLAVRWSLRFGLSYRDVEELLVERGLEVDHVTIYRWVLRCTPLLADAARGTVASAAAEPKAGRLAL